MATNEKKTVAPAKKKSQGFQGIKSAIWVIVACFCIAICIYKFFLGNPANFEGVGEAAAPKNMLGTIYKGGVIVPIIQTLLLTVLALSVERFLALRTAFGKGSLSKFIANIRAALNSGDMAKAQQLCDAQKGSVANVVGATLAKYKQMESETGLNKDQKLTAIKQELEEATALELPTLQMNMQIIFTIVTLGTLTGLLGTVIGMIRSFSALAAGGGADSAQLSTGISEALVNTAFGIGTSWCAVISYNYFSNKIDKLTFALDEVGFSIVQTYDAQHKDEA